MKKIIFMLIGIVILSSCGNSPYKKRKSCKGNGSWYGNRNLGKAKNFNNETYVLK